MIAPRILYNKYLAFQIAFPLLGGFLFGYNTSVISGALLLFKKESKNNLSRYQETIVSASIITAAISSFLGGILAERFGRKKILIFASIFLICGPFVMVTTDFPFMVIFGRSIVGIGIGLSSTVSPIYIAEVAPEKVRGRLILLYQGTIAGGQFLAAIVNAIMYYIDYSQIWRYMLGISAIPAIVQFFGLVFIPESHRWLLSKDKNQEAKIIIKKEGRIYEEDIDNYVDDISTSNKGSLSDMFSKFRHRNNFYEILMIKEVRQSLFIGCGIQMIGQLVGINGVIYYSSLIINMAGIVDVQKVLWYTSLVMFFCFSPLILGFSLIDRIGRRKLSLGSLFGIFISTMVIATGFLAMYLTSPDVSDRMERINHFNDSRCSYKKNCEDCVTIHTCGFCSSDNTTFCLAINQNQPNVSLDGWCSNKVKNENTYFNVNYCPSKYSKIVIVGMAFYLLSFNIGMGPVPWIVTSEIYPYWCRGKNMAISTSIHWTFNAVISVLFLWLTEWITRFGTFWLFAGISFCGFWLIYARLPETNGRSLEEITMMLRNNELWFNKNYY